MSGNLLLIAMGVMVVFGVRAGAEEADAVDQAMVTEIKKQDQRVVDALNKTANDSKYEKKAREEMAKKEQMMEAYGKYIACRMSGSALVAGCWDI